MTNERRTNPVYKTLNQPLTIMGVERTAFFMALGIGLFFFLLFNSFLGGIVLFLVLTYFARLATAKDPKMLVFIVAAMAGQFKPIYDPCKYKPLFLRRI